MQVDEILTSSKGKLLDANVISILLQIVNFTLTVKTSSPCSCVCASFVELGHYEHIRSSHTLATQTFVEDGEVRKKVLIMVTQMMILLFMIVVVNAMKLQ